MTDDTAIRIGRTAPFAMVPEWIIFSSVSPTAKALYALLLSHVNHLRGDGRAWPGVDSVAQVLGFNRRQSIVRYMRELSGLGAIDVETEVSRTGRRNIYVVHQEPPMGYTGHMSGASFYAERDAVRDNSASPDVVDQKKSERPSEGGRTPQRPMGSAQERPMGRTPQRPITRRTKPTEVNQPKSTSSGGADAIAHASRSPESKPAVTEIEKPASRSASKRFDVVQASDLVGLSKAALTQRMTSVWAAVVAEEGGAPWVPDQGGFDAEGYPRERGKHPLGGQIKTILERYGDFEVPVELVRSLLEQVRAHARNHVSLARSEAA